MFSFQTPGPTPRIPSLHTASTRPQSPHQPKIAYVTTLMNFRSFSEGLQVAPAPVWALGTSLSPESMEHRPSERSVPPCILQTLRIARSNFPPLETDEESTLRSYFDPKPTLANPIFGFSKLFFQSRKIRCKHPCHRSSLSPNLPKLLGEPSGGGAAPLSISLRIGNIKSEDPQRWEFV